MVLHRRKEAEVVGELASVVAAVARSEALNSLAELNAQCLELLSEQALAQPVQANLCLHHVGEMWRSLDEQARRRVASCPYLLHYAKLREQARQPRRLLLHAKRACEADRAIPGHTANGDGCWSGASARYQVDWNSSEPRAGPTIVDRRARAIETHDHLEVTTCSLGSREDILRDRLSVDWGFCSHCC